ncbi:unnamed protein product [Brassica napus]|uniref:(rape) hypothetical protein n=1 Tax=Brassica napus TaxID=3708 RepID=A0A816JCF9_BRANA|nr:unnamed protein product [Brassica napus]
MATVRYMRFSSCTIIGKCLLGKGPVLKLARLGEYADENALCGARPNPTARLARSRTGDSKTRLYCYDPSSLSSVEIHRLSPTRSFISLKQPATNGFQRTDIQKLQNSRGGTRDGSEISSSLSCVTMSFWKDHPVMTSSRSSLAGEKSNHTTRFKMSAPLPNSQQPRSIDHEAMANMKTEFMALSDRFSTDRKLNPSPFSPL